MKPLKVYIGWDPRDEIAFRAAAASMLSHSSIPVDIIALKDHELRARGVYWRGYTVEPSGQMFDERDGKPFSTQFSFTRFAIPLIDQTDDWVVFIDADMLFRADIKELLQLADSDKSIMCVQHRHTPPEHKKMDGVLQTVYARKNWSSVMLLRPARCTITRYQLNNSTGTFLHGLLWQEQSTIGALPEEWNWLEGWSSPEIEPKLLHYTRGTPDMLGDHLPHSQEWHGQARLYNLHMTRTLNT